MKKAFTLIELLVVVLIIGILSAIALPQYQKAVEKSRMAEAVQMLHQIHHACQLYEMAGNDCGDGQILTASDLSWPGGVTTANCYDIACFNTRDWQYVDETGGSFLANRLKNGNWENPPYSLGINASSSYNDSGKILCINGTDEAFCQKICGSNYCYID